MTHAPVLHSYTTRLSYADTDPAGIIYYAAWFPKMEALQSDFMYRQGMRQDTLKDTFGWWMATRATECEYLVAAKLYDEIKIEFRVGKIGNSSFQFEHEMWRVTDNVMVARASVSIVVVSPDQSTMRMPGELRGLLKRWATDGAPEQ